MKSENKRAKRSGGFWRLPGLLLLPTAGFHRARIYWRDYRTVKPVRPDGKTAFYRRIWEDAADAVGAEVHDLGDNIIELRRDGKGLRVRGHSTSLDDPLTLSMAGNKPSVIELLEKQGIPVPRGRVYSLDDFTGARAFLHSCDRPIVVKPARGTAAGRGVTANIRGTWQLFKAMGIAGAHNTQILLEEEVAGENYRLLYFDAELLDAVRRCPPEVIGDGVSSIRELIDQDNSERARLGIESAQTPLGVDGELKRTVREQGYRMASVPLPDKRVRLKRVVSDNRRDQNHPAMGELSRDVVEAGAEAVRALNIRLAGVDVITPNPSQALREAGGVVLEVNTTPGLYYHYMTSGEARPVCRQILEGFFQAARAPSSG